MTSTLNYWIINWLLKFWVVILLVCVITDQLIFCLKEYYLVDSKSWHPSGEYTYDGRIWTTIHCGLYLSLSLNFCGLFSICLKTWICAKQLIFSSRFSNTLRFTLWSVSLQKLWGGYVCMRCLIILYKIIDMLNTMFYE